MSKISHSFLLVFAQLVLILQFVNNSIGQSVYARIGITDGPSKVAEIDGSFLSKTPRPNPKNLSFLDNFAGSTGLSERISDLSLSDLNGKPVTFKKFMAGEYVADAEFEKWKYGVNLKPLTNPSAAAHLSWMNDDMGVLMLRDVLPQIFSGPASGGIQFGRLPTEWEIYSSQGVSSELTSRTADTDSAVFVLGRNLRTKGERINGKYLNFVLSGKWQFEDDDAVQLGTEIFTKYEKTIGPASPDPVQITIAKFPVAVPVDNWEADTRGTSILVLSSDTPFKSQSLQRLHEQLRHEIFHLWIPNGVNLTGNYDWFYEGFALYQSLKLGVAVNRITFDDYLDTLSRAYDIDANTDQKLSLIEASNQRWNGANTQVYARGILVAFLCDLKLLERSNGKFSTNQLLRDLYLRHRPPAVAEDANKTILDLLRSHDELVAIIDRNIEGTQSIDWDRPLDGAGLVADDIEGRVKVRVKKRLSGRQKDLLDQLGYNNWRKLSKSNK